MLSKCQNDENVFKWSKFLHDIFNECGLSYIWEYQYTHGFNNDWLKAKVKQILNDQFQQSFLSEINNSSKAVSYRLFKENCYFEEYLDLLSEKERNLLCKIRTTNHRLIIETGRWYNIEKHDRVCTLCNEGLLGDECHYILECSFF